MTIIIDDSLPRSYIWARPEWAQKARERLRRESGAWATPVVVYANGRRTVVWSQPDPDEIHARIEQLKKDHPELLPESVRVARQRLGEFIKTVFPRVRRVTPGLVAAEITSVQPMTAPVPGALMNFEYRTSEEET